jgi:hypothetical protein
MKQQVENLKSWSENLGITPVNQVDLPNMSYVIKLNYQDIDGMSLEKLDEVLVKLSSYAAYLSWQKSLIAARLQLLESEFNQILNSATEKLIKPATFRTYHERRALVIRTNRQLKKANNRVNLLKTKLLRIDNLPRVVQDKLQIVKSIYYRRINEDKEQ